MTGENMEAVVKKVYDIIMQKADMSDNIIIAIDGRCASGKTTLASHLKRFVPCNVIHADEFFLQREQRTVERLNTPGENIDHERLLEEVIVPMKKGEDFYYRPFDCKTMSLGEAVFVKKQKINIIEGSYSCHEKLRDLYNLKIFLDVSADEQMKRIITRNGEEAAKVFKEKWIPLEERYFETFHIKGLCDYCFET